METRAFACINNDEQIRSESSSGGIYSLLAEDIINQGGVIFAAVYDANFQVKHIKIDSLEGIKESRGAKYVFSEYLDSLNEACLALESGQIVMFVGTPCQCAAMISRAGEYRNNLLCVDLVCHGAPSSKTWNDYLNSLNKKNKSIVSINMRCKDTGWSHYKYCWKMKYADGREVLEPQEKNAYMIGFTKNYYLRSSCYSCNFKGYERKTDITLGDFWGVWNVLPEMDDDKGTSLILVHTDKGMKCMDTIKEQMKSVEIDEKKAVQYNPSIVKASVRSKNADKFEAELSKGGDFSKLIYKYEKVSMASKVKYKLKQIIRK